VVRDLEEVRQTLRAMSTHARKRIQAELSHARARLQGLENHHALKEPERRIRDEAQTLDHVRDQLSRALRDWVTVRQGAVRHAATRLQAHAPSRSFARARDRIEGCRRSLVRAASGELLRHRSEVRKQTQLLESFNPYGVLKRGYALVWSGDHATLRKRGAELREGDAIEVQFFDARAKARVTDVDVDVKETS